MGDRRQEGEGARGNRVAEAERHCVRRPEHPPTLSRSLTHVLLVDEGHDDVAQRTEALVDRGRLPQALALRPTRLLALAACARHT